MTIGMAMIRRRDAAPAGQIILPGDSGSWVVPDGVTSVSVVVIGRGGAAVQFGGNASSGAGGALAYANNVAVIPGNSYSYTTGNSPASSIFGITANGGANGGGVNAAAGGTASGGDANFRGADGIVQFSERAAGGSAATYTANGSGTGVGIGISGIGSAAAYGRGGEKVFSGTPGAHQPGGIRIIWGGGRSYPSNAADV